MRPALNFPMRFLLLLLSLILPAIAQARIGETAIQFVDRYGAPKGILAGKGNDKFNPLIEGAIHYTYEYQGWKIRAAFLQLIPKDTKRSLARMLAARRCRREKCSAQLLEC